MKRVVRPLRRQQSGVCRAITCTVSKRHILSCGTASRSASLSVEQTMRRGVSSSARVAQPLNVLRLSLPILDQLRIEEALFRANDSHNWFVVNYNQTDAHDEQACRQRLAVVLGYAGGLRPHELVHTRTALLSGVPMIRRFTGGGTVLVDHRTVFAGFVVNSCALPQVDRFPRSIMKWSAELYGHVFPPHLQFSLQEHDYCFGPRKFGGNAQSIGRTRWLHHTSFLWEYDEALLDRYLRVPEKQPEYRKNRAHSEFVCSMKEACGGIAELATPADFVQSVLRQAVDKGYFSHVVETPLSSPFLQELLAAPHDKRTHILTEAQIKAAEIKYPVT